MTHTTDPRVTLALRSSAILGPLDRAMTMLWNAAGQSRAIGALAGLRDRWRAQPAHDRGRNVAWLLWSAAAVDVLVTSQSQTPPGWLWLVPPAMAASIGLVCVRAWK